MSLKGYEWLQNDKVIMYFTFKYLELTLLQDVSKKDFLEFKDFLQKENCNVLKINYNNFKIIEEE